MLIEFLSETFMDTKCGWNYSAGHCTGVWQHMHTNMCHIYISL